jgi:NTP pyrophosphatase (non-canonical NTP hydrolase)
VRRISSARRKFRRNYGFEPPRLALWEIEELNEAYEVLRKYNKYKRNLNTLLKELEDKLLRLEYIKIKERLEEILEGGWKDELAFGNLADWGCCHLSCS